jgi:nicotinamidase/pyrazinamidase
MAIDFLRSALIIIDVQNDFCPGGALGIEGGDEVIDPLNRLSALFASQSGRVVATQDWHPADHVSFAASHKGKKSGDTAGFSGADSQILWPSHCVQGSRGADFHDALDIKPVNLIVRKGFRAGLESYSAFFENDRKTSTGLDGFLKALSIDTLVLGGLATDYCVLYSALDARYLGYRTFVAKDAIRGVNFPQDSVERALERLEEAGVILAGSGELQ